MEKLELKHLAPYLPYGLKGKYGDSNTIWTLNPAITEIRYESEELPLYHFISKFPPKPILRPLSDLTREIEVNGERFIPIYWFEHNSKDTMYFEDDFLRGIVLRGNSYKITQCSYNILQILLKWHFDVFGLIEKGLAIDINTL